MYTEQIKPGDPYVKLKKCVSISILNFRLFENELDFYSCFYIRENIVIMVEKDQKIE